jgi:Zn-dependent M28 family amino/carboxypeptidase
MNCGKQVLIAETTNAKVDATTAQKCLPEVVGLASWYSSKYGLEYNGADDNASTCVAMLAMARAKKQPAKRSVLFVFHGAEERGLWARIGILAHNSS